IGWMFASGIELNSPTRMIAWSWRLSFYISATILFLWIYNATRDRVPTRAVINGMAGFWVAVIYGGWLAVLYPTLQLKSPAEYVFPHSLLNNTYFYYTTAWGSTCAMLTPIALAALAAKPGRTWGRVLKITMGLSVVPIIFS